MPGREIHPDGAGTTFFLFVIPLQQATDFVGLYPNDRISLRIEVHSSLVDFHPDLEFVQLVPVAYEGLLTDKLEKEGLLGRVREKLVAEYPSQLSSFFKQRNHGNICGMKR